MNRHEPMLPEADVRETPPELFTELNQEFHFTMDGCATHANTKVRTHYCTENGRYGTLECCTPELECEPHLLGAQDGLAEPWNGERVWVNPPFSDIGTWVQKAWCSDAELVVMLVPATRTEQGWWHDWVEPFRDGGPAVGGLQLTTRFLRGRTHFLKDGKPIVDEKTGKRSSPKFGCVLLVWRRTS